MKPINQIEFSNGIIKIGELYVPRRVFSSFYANGLISLAIFVTGFTFEKKILVEILGLDALSYGIAKVSERGVKVLNRRGSETYISHASLISVLKSFRFASCLRKDSLSFYMKRAELIAKDFKSDQVIKLSERLRNLEEWPPSALVSWATSTLGLSTDEVPPPSHINNPKEMIINMIKLKIGKSKAAELRKKLAAELKENRKKDSINSISGRISGRVGMDNTVSSRMISRISGDRQIIRVADLETGNYDYYITDEYGQEPISIDVSSLADDDYPEPYIDFEEVE